MVGLLVTAFLWSRSAKCKVRSPAYQHAANSESRFNRRWRSRQKLTWIFTSYLFIVITLRPQQPWNHLTENPVVGLALTILDLPQAIVERVKSAPSNWDQKFIDFITDRIAAPPVDLSATPRAYLKSP